MASTASPMVSLDDIKRIDPTGMYRWLSDFPVQAQEAVRIGSTAALTIKAKGIRAIVLTGMGGSAIAGDLLRSYLAEELQVPFVVNRSYTLPEFVSPDVLVIVSSYSGNTEETLSAYRQAIRRKAKILCITTGGETGRLALRHKHPVIKVPPGLQPRAALGYAFFPLLVALIRAGFIKSKDRDIRETITRLKSLSLLYADPANPANTALQTAMRLHGKLPVIYSPGDWFDAVNVRWRGELSENAKHLAYGHVFPELNHNEIVGWNQNRELMKMIAVVFLRDAGSHPRIRLRQDITENIVREYASEVINVCSEGKSLLTRIFSLVSLGDWTSFYLAILNGQDPTPVKVIDYLKSELAKS